MRFFPLSWHSHSSTVSIFGIDDAQRDKRTCVFVRNIPTRLLILMDTNETAEKALRDDEALIFGELIVSALRKSMHGVGPLSSRLVRMQLINGAHIDLRTGGPFLFPYLELFFDTEKAARMALECVEVRGLLIGTRRRTFAVHSFYDRLWFEFLLARNLQVCNWLEVSDAVLRAPLSKQTLCEFEYDVEAHKIERIDDPPPPPPVMLVAFDIEVFSHIKNKFPSAKEQADEIFQISLVSADAAWLITRGQVAADKLHERFAPRQVHVHNVPSEFCIIDTFSQLLRQLRPFIIVGYNSMNFDWPYLIDRAATYANAWPCLERLSMSTTNLARVRELSWSSAAFADQTFRYMCGDGFAHIDLMQLIKRQFKLDKYSLDFVASTYLNTRKDNLSADKVFMAFEAHKNRHPAADQMLGVVGAYCIQDSLLVFDLFNRLEQTSSLLALSDTTNCLVEALTVRGVTHRVMSIIERFCYEAHITIAKDNRRSGVRDAGGGGESYRGATVFEPKRGLYEKPVSYDFGSLYPNIIRNGNFCASTLLQNEEVIAQLPADKVFVCEWEDHVNCEHDTQQQLLFAQHDEFKRHMAEAEKNPQAGLPRLNAFLRDNWSNIHKIDECKRKAKAGKRFCAKRRFVWYKGFEGVYPRIAKMLLDRRAAVREQYEALSKQCSVLSKSVTCESEASTLNIMQTKALALNALQLALKTVANSLYGFTGSRSAQLQCLPVAMCTTNYGRSVIERAVQIIRQHNGDIIYGDTDSAYAVFPHVKFEDLYAFAKNLADVISSHFPHTLKMLFEKAVYCNYLIVNKKQYAYRVANADGTPKEKICAKGLLLARRDNCNLVRQIYARNLVTLFNKRCTEPDALFTQIALDMIAVCQRTHVVKEDEGSGDIRLDYDLFAINKSVREWRGVHECNSKHKVQLGSYKVNRFKPDNSKGISDEHLFYLSSLQPQVRLAQELCDRGEQVSAGQRLLYVICSKVNSDMAFVGAHKRDSKTQNGRVEELEWFKRNAHIMRLDLVKYCEMAVNSFDNMLNAIQHERNFSLDTYKAGCACVERAGKIVACRMCKLRLDNVKKLIKGNMHTLLAQMHRKQKLNEQIRRLFCEIVFEKKK